MRCAARRRRESGVSNRVGPRASDLEARRPGLETGVSINGGNSSREPKENTVEKSMPSPRDLVKEGASLCLVPDLGFQVRLPHFSGSGEICSRREHSRLSIVFWREGGDFRR